MNYYFAPMEGITGYVLRNAHARHFPGIDKYYLPFIAAQSSHRLKNKEKTDVSPANNADLHAVPQVLTKSAEDFVATAEALMEMGYREINLNLGCPSPTVTSKAKGAGMLRDTENLDRFLDGIFEGLAGTGAEISVKTRIGCEDPAEADAIFDVYAKYPFSEIIIHPRTLREFYGGEVHRDVFYGLCRKMKTPCAFNGNIDSAGDLESLLAEKPEDVPEISAVMCGRGLLRNPALVREMRGGPALTKEELFIFQKEVCEGLRATLSGPVPPLSKMKELWWYMKDNFPGKDREYCNIKKAGSFAEYESAVRAMFG